MDLAYRVLDLELIDCDGSRCGRVDDLELADEDGSAPRLSAILVGPEAMAGRLPRRIASMLRALSRDELTRVEWSDVDDIVDASVRLKRSGSELGLGEGERQAGSWIRRLPGAQ